MTRLISIIAATAAALALAAPALADVKASRPGDVYKDAFRTPPASASWSGVHPVDVYKDYFRARPGGNSWNSLRPLGTKWGSSSWT